MKKYLSYILLAFLCYLLYINEDTKYIVAGVGIFIIGMHFMEDGFKLFSGGILERLVAKSTNTVSKSVFLGITATAILQSSTLIAIIVISFLSAKIISLAGALGVVFGSAVGTTTTTWIVSTLGLKIDIAAFALPMIIFGVIFRFYKNKNFQGFGNILLGLGFIFLGIGYMKDGFEELKHGFNLNNQEDFKEFMKFFHNEIDGRKSVFKTDKGDLIGGGVFSTKIYTDNRLGVMINPYHKQYIYSKIDIEKWHSVKGNHKKINALELAEEEKKKLTGMMTTFLSDEIKGKYEGIEYINITQKKSKIPFRLVNHLFFGKILIRYL